MWPALAAMQFSERSWLAALSLSRAFIALIFMTYAASLPTLTHEWSMTATQAGFVQTWFSAGFAISLFVTSWLSDHRIILAPSEFSSGPAGWERRRRSPLPCSLAPTSRRSGSMASWA
jgi:MFS family permease